MRNFLFYGNVMCGAINSLCYLHLHIPLNLWVGVGNLIVALLLRPEEI